MPEEILETRKEKVKDVKEEKKDNFVQKFLKQIFGNNFSSPLKGIFSKMKNSKDKSDSKKGASKVKSSTVQEKK